MVVIYRLVCKIKTRQVLDLKFWKSSFVLVDPEILGGGGAKPRISDGLGECRS